MEDETIRDSVQTVAATGVPKHNGLREMLRNQAQSQGAMVTTVGLRRLNSVERAELRRQVSSQRAPSVAVYPAP